MTAPYDPTKCRDCGGDVVPDGSPSWTRMRRCPPCSLAHNRRVSLAAAKLAFERIEHGEGGTCR
jgi:hypothetical protein